MARRRAGRSGLTKADLVGAVYERHGGLTKEEAVRIVEAIFGTVKTVLSSGRAVKIKNFGTFQVMDRPDRRGVNPATGKPMVIAAHRGLNFKPAGHLKQVVKDDD